MAEYIEREALLKWAREFYPNDLQFASAVINAPTTDVEEVKHGKWINQICSICNCVNPTITEDFCGEYISRPLAYCPNCGAKMDLGDDEE